MSDSYTCRFTEVHELLDRIVPGVHTGGISTEWCAVNDYHRAVAILSCGALAGTLDVAIWQATNTAGAGAKFVTGKAITQLDGADDNATAAIELRAEELDVDGGFDCIRVQTLNGGSSQNVYEVLLFGIVPRYAPTGGVNYDEVVD